MTIKISNTQDPRLQSVIRAYKRQVTARPDRAEQISAATARLLAELGLATVTEACHAN